jgi:hypothetical protein
MRVCHGDKANGDVVEEQPLVVTHDVRCDPKRVGLPGQLKANLEPIAPPIPEDRE